MKTFSLFDAKNKLSEVVASAEKGEPQIITKNGRKAAVVISYSEWQKQRSAETPLVDFLLDNPTRRDGVDIDLKRDKSTFPDRLDFNGEDFA